MKRYALIKVFGLIALVLSVIISKANGAELKEYTVKSIKDSSYLSEPSDDKYRNEMSMLDLYIPEGAKNFPTLVYFHGGGLTAGKREGPTWMVKDGIAVVAVEYRLYPKCKHPDYLNDCAAATCWVFKHIAEYGGDPKKIFIGGYSAGAYLTAMLAMDKKYLEAQGINPDTLAGALVQSGQMITHFTVRKQLDYLERQGVCDENSPMYHIRRRPFPIFLQCGDHDYPSRQEENRLFESMMIKYAIQPRDKIRYCEYEGNHGSLPQNKYFKQDAEIFILKNSGQPHREPEVEPRDVTEAVYRKYDDNYYLAVANQRGEKLILDDKELSPDDKGTYTLQNSPENSVVKLEQKIPLVMIPEVKEYVLKNKPENRLQLPHGIRMWREDGNLMIFVEKKAKSIVAPKDMSFTRGDMVEVFVDRTPLDKLYENKMNFAPEDVGVNQYLFSVKADPHNRNKQFLRRSTNIEDLSKTSKAYHNVNLTPEGYTMQICIPFEEVSPLGEKNVIGMNIVITDLGPEGDGITSLSAAKCFSGTARLHYPLFNIE